MGLFKNIVSHDGVPRFDFIQPIYHVLGWTVSILPFPSSIIFAFYEQRRNKSYIVHYLLTLLPIILLFPITYFLYYAYKIALNSAGMLLLKAIVCALPIALFVASFKKKQGINITASYRRNMYINIATRLVLVFSMCLYLYNCYSTTGINGYLRNEFLKEINHYPPPKDGLVCTLYFPLEMFREGIDAAGGVENYFVRNMFIRDYDMKISTHVSDSKKRKISDRLIAVYYNYLSLPLTNFTSIHPYNTMLYLFNGDAFDYCVVDVYMPYFL